MSSRQSLISTLKSQPFDNISIHHASTVAFLLTIALIIILSAVSTTSLFNIPTQPVDAVSNPAVIDGSVPKLNDDKPWFYDFTNIPEGVLPTDDWYIEQGVKVAGYNDELQAYTDRTDNVRVEDRRLIIEARDEQLYGRDYTSARIDTRNSFAFTYGTLEVRMRAPSGTGTWPAAWLFPVDPRYNPTDFGIAPNDPLAWSMNGEIDFYESVGSIPHENIPAAHSYNTLQRPTIYTPVKVPTQYSNYHTYGVIKTENSITFTLDGKPYAQRKKTSLDPLEWPFDQPYYLILNLAVGGKWAGSDGIDVATAPWKMEIQSISYKPL